MELKMHCASVPTVLIRVGDTTVQSFWLLMQRG